MGDAIDSSFMQLVMILVDYLETNMHVFSELGEGTCIHPYPQFMRFERTRLCLAWKLGIKEPSNVGKTL